MEILIISCIKYGLGKDQGVEKLHIDNSLNDKYNTQYENEMIIFQIGHKKYFQIA